MMMPISRARLKAPLPTDDDESMRGKAGAKKCGKRISGARLERPMRCFITFSVRHGFSAGRA